MRANEFLAELWNRPYRMTYRLGAREGDVRFNFKTANGRPGRVEFQRFLGRNSRNQLIPLVVRIDFYVDGHWGTTGGGDALAIFSTVVKACQAYFNMYRNKPLVILTETDDEKKRGVYARLARYFPEYELYPTWAEDPVVGDFIESNLADGVPEDAVVLKKRDYDPEQVSADTDQYELNELTDNDYYGGNDDDNILPWAEALAAFKQWAEDSNALDFEEKDGGRTAAITWGPELGAPYAQYVMFVSPHGDGEMYGMLLGLYEDGEFDEIQSFKVPCSYNGVNYAARVSMQVRM